MAARDGDSEVKSLLASLSDALADQADKTVFAVGGKINVHSLMNLSSGGSEKSPIVFRWDTGEHSCRKASFPVIDDDATSHAAFAKLLSDSEPATYGVGAKAVLDETYRKAGKMNAARFSTNFNPYEHGVIDVITQALLNSNNRGVRAELYNLNVSGNSGLIPKLLTNIKLTYHRSIPVPRADSSHMSIHPGRRTRWALSSFVFHIHTKVISYPLVAFAMLRFRSY